MHKYRQNRPFPIKITWGFIGNGRNVSICEQAWGWQGKTGWGGRPGWAVTWLGLAGGQVTRGRVCWGTARSWLTGLTGLVGAAGGWSEPGMGFAGGVPG